MRNKLRYIYLNTLFGKFLSSIKNLVRNHILSDKHIVKSRFRKKMGNKIDLKNPSTLNEKINWLKLYDRTELHTICADKYKVRKYVRDNIGERFLAPMSFQTKNPIKIVPSNLPDYPCIIKTNHDSSGGVFVYDKHQLDYKEIQKQLNKRLKRNYYFQSREWQYKNIEPRIIVEKLLLDKEGNIPFDYKVHCFNGKPRMIQVDMGRGTEKHYRNWYNVNWKREPFKWTAKLKHGKSTEPSSTDVEKPKQLDRMLQLSSKLAKPFDYVRVDWYDLDGELFFGELTFHHDGGYRPILPKEWDLKLGKELELTKLK